MESYRDHKSQIRNRIIGEVRELTIDKENEIREESFKKKHFRRSRDGYGQPPAYNEKYIATVSKLDVKFLCCSCNIE